MLYLSISLLIIKLTSFVATQSKMPSNSVLSSFTIGALVYISSLQLCVPSGGHALLDLKYAKKIVRMFILFLKKSFAAVAPLHTFKCSRF